MYITPHSGIAEMIIFKTSIVNIFEDVIDDQ